MNIVFFSRYYSPHIGGVEKHVEQIGNVLVRKGHRVSVITEDVCKKKKVEKSKINIYRIHIKNNNWFKKFDIWYWIWKNRKIIEEADIIHCHDVFFWYLPFRFLYPKKNVYITFHGYESFPIPFKNILVRKVSEMLSDGNICIGKFIEKWYFTTATYISYGGVNIHSDKSKSRIKSLLYFGRLDKDTGITAYYNAYVQLKKLSKDFRLTVVGEGSMKYLLKDVRIIDFKKEISSYIQESQFIFTSGYLSMLEAMINKRLVFATYNNELKKDYLDMSPFAKFIIISTPEEIANKVKYYLKYADEEKKIVENAYKWAKNQSWNSVVEIYEKLWKK